MLFETLVYEILSDIGDFRMQFGDTGFRFVPVFRELFLASHAALPLRYFRQELLQRLTLVYDFAIRQGYEVDDSPVHANC